MSLYYEDKGLSTKELERRNDSRCVDSAARNEYNRYSLHNRFLTESFSSQN